MEMSKYIRTTDSKLLQNLVSFCELGLTEVTTVLTPCPPFFAIIGLIAKSAGANIGFGKLA